MKTIKRLAALLLMLVDNGQTLTMTGEKLMTTSLALNFPAPNLSLMIYINPAV